MKIPGFGTEQIKHLLGGGLGQGLQQEYPVASQHTVNKHKDIASAVNHNCVVKSNVNMHLVQVLTYRSKGQRLLALPRCDLMQPQGQQKLVCVDPYALLNSSQKVPMILELAASCDLVQVFARPIYILVQSG